MRGKIDIHKYFTGRRIGGKDAEVILSIGSQDALSKDINVNKCREWSHELNWIVGIWIVDKHCESIKWQARTFKGFKKGSI